MYTVFNRVKLHTNLSAHAHLLRRLNEQDCAY